MSKSGSLLIVDDNEEFLIALKLMLAPHFAEVKTESRPDTIFSHLQKHAYDLILLDMNFKAGLNTGNEGLFWLREIKKMDTKAEIVMITAYGDIDLAVRSVKEGAIDFMVKPWHNQKLLDLLRDVLLKKKGAAKPETDKRQSIPGLIGESEKLREVLYKIEKIAPKRPRHLQFRKHM